MEQFTTLRTAYEVTYNVRVKSRDFCLFLSLQFTAALFSFIPLRLSGKAKKECVYLRRNRQQIHEE